MATCAAGLAGQQSQRPRKRGPDPETVPARVGQGGGAPSHGGGPGWGAGGRQSGPTRRPRIAGPQRARLSPGRVRGHVGTGPARLSQSAPRPTRRSGQGFSPRSAPRNRPPTSITPRSPSTGCSSVRATPTKASRASSCQDRISTSSPQASSHSLGHRGTVGGRSGWRPWPRLALRRHPGHVPGRTWLENGNVPPP